MVLIMFLANHIVFQLLVWQQLKPLSNTIMPTKKSDLKNKIL